MSPQLYTPDSGNVTFGRGKLLFDQFINNLRVGQFVHLGNCKSFSIGINPDELTMKDYTTETSAPYKRVTTGIEVPLKITGFEFAKPNLKQVFMGDETSLTQASASITGETLAASTLTGLKGSLFETTKRTITGVTVLQGTATKVSGTDWEVFDSLGGVIRVLPTGSIIDGTVLTANYTAGDLTGVNAVPIVRIATKTSIQGRLRFIPANTTGPNNEVIIWNAKLTPDGDVNLIADEFAEWNLVGSVQSDASGTYGGSSANPYGQFYLR